MILESLLSFMIKYKWIILFYSIIILVVYLNRKKFDVQAGFIFLFRTKKGIPFINKVADKYRELIKIIGYIGIGIGFIGMIFIAGYFIFALYNIFANPAAPPAVAPIIPGVKIPGFPIFLPFWYGIIALFIVVVVHEFAHGIVARAHGQEIKNTGIVFFGPLIGAFVEPDEKKLKKTQDIVQYSTFAAGPFSNVILAGIVFVLLLFVTTPLANQLTYSNGVSFAQIQNNTPAQISGLSATDEIIYVNNERINTTDDFMKKLETVRPNETITLGSKDKNFTLITAANPSNPKKGYLGVVGITTIYTLKSEKPFTKYSYIFLKILSEQLFWIYALSLGIGLANLIPMGPIDGGRMLQVALKKTAKDEKKGNLLWARISLFFFALLLLLIFIPIIRLAF